MLNESVTGPNSVAITGTATGDKSRGVIGKAEGTGVKGEGDGTGVWGHGKTWMGVYGFSESTTGGAGVMGEHRSGVGVKAVSQDGVGLAASSSSNEAIHAETKSPATAAIAAYNINPDGTGAAIFAKKEGTQGHAGFFAGNVFVTGELAVGGALKVGGRTIDPGQISNIESLAARISSLEKTVFELLIAVGNIPPGG